MIDTVRFSDLTVLCYHMEVIIMAIDGVKTSGIAYQRNEKSEPVSKESVDVDNMVKTQNISSVPLEQDPFVKDASMKELGGVSEPVEQQNKDSIKRAVEEINKKSSGSEAVFGIHDETNRVTIKIVDKDSKKVIREVPPEKTLDMIAKVWEIAGLMVDEKG